MLKPALTLSLICFWTICSAQDELKAQYDPNDYAQYRMSSSIGLSIGSANYVGDFTEDESYSGLAYLSPVSAGLNTQIPISEAVVGFFGLNYSRLSHSALIDGSHKNFRAQLIGANLGAFYRFDNGKLFMTNERFNVMIGAGGSFHSNILKTDLRDANGTLYNYWTDGTIRDLPEGSMSPVPANIIYRDYEYESDIADAPPVFGVWGELNLGYKITPRVTGRVGYRQTFAFTDLLDGSETYSGNDRFNNFYVGLEVNLASNPFREELKEARLTSKTIDTEDADADGVDDLHDECANTPRGYKVDSKGCALDADMDGVPDAIDKEPNSTMGSMVNEDGVAYSEEEILVMELLRTGNMRYSENEREYAKKYPDLFKKFDYTPNEVENTTIGTEGD